MPQSTRDHNSNSIYSNPNVVSEQEYDDKCDDRKETHNESTDVPHVDQYDIENDSNDDPDIYYHSNRDIETTLPVKDGHDVPAEQAKNNDTPIIIKQLADHFTLQLPTSVIRYRSHNNAARVIHAHDHQFVLEERYNKETKESKIEIRRIHDTSEGLRLLRFLYMVMTAFWTGFFFVFCLEIILFLFLDLAIQLGITRASDRHIAAAGGIIASFVPFVYSLASALVIAGAFIQDTWTGHYLIRNFTFRHFTSTAVEWIFFFAFMLAPVVVMCITLLLGYDKWWDATVLTWFIGIGAFFALFAANVVQYEVKCAWTYVAKKLEQEGKGKPSFWKILLQCIHLRQAATYSGYKRVTYLAMGSIRSIEYTDKASEENRIDESYKEHLDWWAHVTKLNIFSCEKLGLFKPLDKPKRLFTVDDARDVRPFMTGFSWSLERVFCRPRNSRYIAIVKGPGALSKSQMRSSVICSIIGTLMVFAVIASLLVFLGAGIPATIFFLFLGLCYATPSVRSALNLYKIGREYLKFSELFSTTSSSDDNNEDTDRDSNSSSSGVYMVQETYKISKPTARFYWTIFLIEITIFLLYPFGSLLRVQNWRLAALFFVTAGVTTLRYYINAIVALEEVGSLVTFEDKEKDSPERWRELSRLNEIVGSITTARSRWFWISLLGVTGSMFVAVFVMAIVSQENSSSATYTSELAPPFIFVDQFEYVQLDSLRYPTCQLTNSFGDSPLNTMADFAFLAGVAYRAPGNSTQYALDEWFKSAAVERHDVVTDFRDKFNTTSLVEFKLISFPEQNNWSYITVRGTSSPWDMLTDLQLWGAASLLQVIRAILPLGEFCTPVLDQLINIIASIETDSIEKVSFYRDTTQFARYIQNNSDVFGGVAITGHSLGGGLSLITGAQANIPAVALSGPNAMLSRRSFIPPVSEEALDSNTFNIIPERDVVPMIDDPAQNWQSIRCQAGATDFLACHDSMRALCEILYTCGSRGRPIPCECVEGQYGFIPSYDYPEPIPLEGTQISFADACAAKRAEAEEFFGRTW